MQNPRGNLFPHITCGQCKAVLRLVQCCTGLSCDCPKAVCRWSLGLCCPFLLSYSPNIFAGLYLLLGFGYNVLVLKVMPDWEAVPHIEALRTAGNYIAAVVALLWERAVVIMPALQEGLDYVRSKFPFSWRGTGDTFFPVRNVSTSRSW